MYYQYWSGSPKRGSWLRDRLRPSLVPRSTPLGPAAEWLVTKKATFESDVKVLKWLTGVEVGVVPLGDDASPGQDAQVTSAAVAVQTDWRDPVRARSTTAARHLHTTPKSPSEPRSLFQYLPYMGMLREISYLKPSLYLFSAWNLNGAGVVRVIFQDRPMFSYIIHSVFTRAFHWCGWTKVYLENKGEKRILVIFQDRPMFSHIIQKVSVRASHWCGWK